jgi:hypothetical protein
MRYLPKRDQIQRIYFQLTQDLAFLCTVLLVLVVAEVEVERQSSVGKRRGIERSSTLALKKESVIAYLSRPIALAALC